MESKQEKQEEEIITVQICRLLAGHTVKSFSMETIHISFNSKILETISKISTIKTTKTKMAVVHGRRIISNSQTACDVGAKDGDIF